jgi:MFS family permease
VIRDRIYSHLPALQHRNFRLLWAGQLISVTGSMMQNAAILWHVSLLVPPERKALALGMVGLVRIVPIVAFSTLSGVVADAFNRRRVMIITQLMMMVMTAILAFHTFSGLTAIWPVYLLAGLSGAGLAFDAPSRQSLVPNLVPHEHLPNAISLNTIMFQAGSILGPTLAGLVIGNLGVGWAYALNAGSFLAVIVALLQMRGVPGRAPGDPGDVSFKAAREGLRFVFSSPIIRSTMLLDFFATFFSSATTLLPIFAQDILHVGARGYGWLYAAPSAGALVSGLVLVRFANRIDRRGRVFLGALFAYGTATVLFGVSRTFWLTFFCLALSGAADMLSAVLRNIIRQLGTPDELRGRMTGVNMTFFMGGRQLGDLEAGVVAHWLGAPFSVISGGICCLVSTAWVAMKTPALIRYRRTSPANGAPEAAAGRKGP